MSAVRKNAISILALLIAVPTLVYSLSVSTPRDYALSAGSMLGAAAASVSASVAENPDNTLAAQFAAEQVRLDQQKADIAAMNSDQIKKGISLGEMLGASSFFISIILLILVALNFYYDSKRGGSPMLPRKFFVDLR